MLPPVVLCPACGTDVQPFGDHCLCDFCGHEFAIVNAHTIEFDADEVEEDNGG